MMNKGRAKKILLQLIDEECERLETQIKVAEINFPTDLYKETLEDNQAKLKKLKEVRELLYQSWPELI